MKISYQHIDPYAEPGNPNSYIKIGATIGYNTKIGYTHAGDIPQVVFNIGMLNCGGGKHVFGSYCLNQELILIGPDGRLNLNK